MLRSIILLVFLFSVFHSTYAQSKFPEMVAKSFGSDQELVNGILMSNKYWFMGGQPYFFEGKFREGFVNIKNKREEKVRLRFNLYSQRVEINYQTANGNWLEFESVPHYIHSFSLEGFEFRYKELPDKKPMYYQFITNGQDSCYIAWKKELRYSSGRASTFQMEIPEIHCILHSDQRFIRFHNKRTFLNTFPKNSQKDAAKVLKQLGFNFKHASASEMDKLMHAVFHLYEQNNRL